MMYEAYVVTDNYSEQNLIYCFDIKDKKKLK